MNKIIFNDFFLLSVVGILGIIIGNLKINKFKLGPSAALFIGLILSYFLTKYKINHYNNINSSINISILISKNIFQLSLLIFISSIGLIASKEIIFILKKYSIKFFILAIVITLTGAISSFLCVYRFKIDNTFINGIFTGALTSSPGLASALESAKTSTQIINTGIGYSFGYIPGVLSVIFSMYLLPIIFKIDIKKEFNIFKNEFKKNNKFLNFNKTNNQFNIVSYLLIILAGISLGSIKIHIFNNNFKLGFTGGILIVSLLAGNIKPFWIFNFNFNKNVLNFLKETGLILFLSTIGLNYGYSTLSSLNISNLFLFLSAFFVAFISLLSGFFIGKYILKLNWIILSGSLCGGMTSTPGLAAAIDSTETEDAVTGYGATYPFALIFMVIFTNLINLF